MKGARRVYLLAMSADEGIEKNMWTTSFLHSGFTHAAWMRVSGSTRIYLPAANYWG